MKTVKLLKVLLAVLIIATIIVAILVINKFVNDDKSEKELQGVIEAIYNQEQNSTDIIPIMDAEIQGIKVVGIIKIPRVDLEYPILERTDVNTLNISVTKFWGNKINEIGNVCLAGHNNMSGSKFGKLKNLEIGDKIELIDLQNVNIEYEIFDISIIDPNDISCILPVQEGTREVTLITCTNGDKNRRIVKARENINIVKGDEN